MTQEPARVYAINLLNPGCDISAHLPVLRYAARGEVVEIGVRTGVSTAALLLGVEENGGHVYSIDADSHCAVLYEGHAQWTFLTGHSRDDADRILSRLPQPDLLLIDGDHSYEMVLNDLEKFGTLVHPGGIILLHDADLQVRDNDGVRPAIREFTRRYSCAVRFFPGSHGLGIITVCAALPLPVPKARRS